MSTTHTIKRGDTYRRSAVVKDESGGPANLTGASVWFTVKRTNDTRNDDVNAVLQLTWEDGGASDGITVATPASGAIIIELTPEQTDLLTAEARYRYDVQVLVADDVFTPDDGIINVLRDVTRTRV